MKITCLIDLAIANIRQSAIKLSFITPRQATVAVSSIINGKFGRVFNLLRDFRILLTFDSIFPLQPLEKGDNCPIVSERSSAALKESPAKPFFSSRLTSNTDNR